MVWLRRVLALALAPLAAAAAAEEPLATLGANNGSLPPPYHRSTSVSVLADGSVRLRACRGYGDADCRTYTGRAPAGAVEAILAAAEAAGLAARAPAADPNPPVGGGAEWGSVRLGDRVIDLPAFPAGPDADRVAAVLSAIRAAVPGSLRDQAAAATGE